MRKQPKTLIESVALKCLDCSSGSREEAVNCTVFGCPLYSFRTDCLDECGNIKLHKDKPKKIKNEIEDFEVEW